MLEPVMKSAEAMLLAAEAVALRVSIPPSMKFRGSSVCPLIATLRAMSLSRAARKWLASSRHGNLHIVHNKFMVGIQIAHYDLGRAT